MRSLEVIAECGTAEVPMTDTPEELIAALGTIVRTGINDNFSDIAWLYYYGVFEKIQTETDPNLQDLLKIIDSQGIQKTGNDRSYLNVLARADDLATNMAAWENRGGGGFYRVSFLDEGRFVVVPAKHLPHVVGQNTEVDIDLSYGISFAGTALTEALFNTGIPAEIIDYRDEPDFPAYRTATLGKFFARYVLSD